MNTKPFKQEFQLFEHAYCTGYEGFEDTAYGPYSLWHH